MARATTTRASTSTSASSVIPGKGPGSPKYGEIYETLVKSKKVRAATANEVAEMLSGKRRGVVVDVRQPLEHAELRLVGTKSAPYLVPMENVLRRASGYFLAIKGGLKERNVAFVDVVAEVTKNRRDAVVLVDLRGGDLDIAPLNGSTAVSDRGDSLSLRAAYELVQAGYTDVRYVPGGFPALIDEGGLEYESEKYAGLLDAVGEGARKTLMYSNLLPDPSLAPGFVVQIVLLAALAFLQQP